MIYGDPNDNGWNYQIQSGVETIQSEYPGIITDITFNLTRSQCLTTAISYVQSNYELIFITDFVESCALIISQTYRNVSVVVVNNGTLYGQANLATCYNDILFGRFIVGALVLKQGIRKVCFMTSNNFPGITRHSNAILNGMHYDNSGKFSLTVGLTNGFNNATSERRIFDRLIAEANCGIVIQQLNSVNVQELVRHANLLGIGYASDMRGFVGESVLTSSMVVWDKMFSYFISKALNGTFIQEVYFGSASDSGLLAPFSSHVNAETIRTANIVKRDLLSGEINPYCGTIVEDTFGHACVSENTFFSQLLNNIVVITDH